MRTVKGLKVMACMILLSTLGFPVGTFAQTNKSDSQLNGSTLEIKVDGKEGKNRWKTSDVAITATSVPDAVTSIQIDDGTKVPFSGSYTYSMEGKHMATVQWADAAGKQLGSAVKKIKLDKTKPIVNVQAVAGIPGENGWLRSDAEISVGAEDPISKLIRVDLGLDNRGLKIYDGPVQLTQEGIHPVSAEAEDNAGNVEHIETFVKIDKTKPVISDVYLQNEYYWDEDFPIRFQASDTVSGVASIHATINGKDVANGSNYHFTEPGWHTYRIEVKDVAGWTAVYETKFEVYIPAKISFEPDHLQLDYGNGMATNFIELPREFQPELINFSTIMTNGQIVHVQDPQYGYVKNPIDGEDQNGVRRMKLKYEREALIPVIEPLPGADKWKPTFLTMFGEWDVYHFKGYDQFVVLNSGYVPPPPDVTPPELSVEPNDGALNVSVNATPVIAFSEPVLLANQTELSDESAAALIRFTDANGVNIPFSVNWMKNTSSIQLNPNIQLEGNTTYTIEFAENSVMDAIYNPLTKKIDGLNNLNRGARFTFTTEQNQLVIPPPLPIPVIEVEDPDIDPTQPSPPAVTIGNPPVGEVLPQQLPLPPKPPVSSKEWQVYLNNVVEREIANTTDEAFIIREVNRVIDNLGTALEADTDAPAASTTRTNAQKQNAVVEKDAGSSSFYVLDHTVTTVMASVADKMAKGEIDPENVVNSAARMLKIGHESLLSKLGPDDSARQKDKALQSFSKLFDHVIQKFYTYDISTDLAVSLEDALNPVVELNTMYKVSNNAIISDPNKVRKAAKNLERVRHDLGDKLSVINVPNHFSVFVKGKQNAHVTIQSKVVKELLENNVNLAVQNEKRTGIVIPAAWLKQTGGKKVQIQLENVADSNEDNDVYEYQVKVDGKPVEEFAEGVTIRFPYNSKAGELLKVYYFDEKGKKWRVLESKDGQAVKIVLEDGFASFTSNYLGKFKVSE